MSSEDEDQTRTPRDPEAAAVNGSLATGTTAVVAAGLLAADPTTAIVTALATTFAGLLSTAVSSRGQRRARAFVEGFLDGDESDESAVAELAGKASDQDTQDAIYDTFRRAAHSLSDAAVVALGRLLRAYLRGDVEEKGALRDVGDYLSALTEHEIASVLDLVRASPSGRFHNPSFAAIIDHGLRQLEAHRILWRRSSVKVERHERATIHAEVEHEYQTGIENDVTPDEPRWRALMVALGERETYDRVMNE